MRKRQFRNAAALTAAALAGLHGSSARAVTINQFYSADNGTGSTPQYVLSTVSNFLAGTVTTFTLNATNPVVNMPLGDFFRFGISDSIQNNPNPASGAAWDIAYQGTNGVTQPTNLGLGVLNYNILSSDTNATRLAAVQKSSAGIPHGINDFNTTGIFGAKLTFAAAWETTPADTETGVGTVGINYQMFAGQDPNSVIPTTTRGTAEMTFFTASAANLTSATNLFTKLAYKGVSAGTVTLTPAIVPAQTYYWVNTNQGTVTSNGSPASSATYALTPFNAAHDTLNPMDGVASANNLIVNVTPLPTAHSIVALVSSSFVALNSDYGATITNGSGVNQGVFSTGTNKLTAVGSNGSYLGPTATGIDDASHTGNTGPGPQTGNVDVNGFSPSSDPETFAFNFLVNGTQANTSQVQTLVADINSNNSYGYGASIASSVDPGNVFPTQYNVFLSFSGGQLPGTADAFLGWDMTLDPSFGANGSVSAVAVIPEPASLTILGLGAIGLLGRRHRLRRL